MNCLSYLAQRGSVCALLVSTMAGASLVGVPNSVAAHSANQALGGKITVFAAASLRDAFREVGRNFESSHAGSTVTFNFAGSQQLAEQIGFGAPADVFISANQRLMDAVVKTGRVETNTPRIFARNRLVVVYPKANPGKLRILTDLSRPGLKIVIANKTVPVGSYTLDFLNKASAYPEFGSAFAKSTLANVVSYEEDVRAVFSKVALGEADAGVVYASDVVADKSAQVGKIDIPADLNTIATYPVAALKDGQNMPLAQAFARYLLTSEAQATLVKYGFLSATGDALGSTPKAGTLLINGVVRRSLAIQTTQLRKLNQVSLTAKGRDGIEATYTGPTVQDVLRLAGAKTSAKTVTITGGDGDSQDIALSELTGDAAILAFDTNSTLITIVPAKTHKYWVKDVIKLEVN
jgi:molybdate transport system substrate-binding protein